MKLFFCGSTSRKYAALNIVHGVIIKVSAKFVFDGVKKNRNQLFKA